MNGSTGASENTLGPTIATLSLGGALPFLWQNHCQGENPIPIQIVLASYELRNSRTKGRHFHGVGQPLHPGHGNLRSLDLTVGDTEILKYHDLGFKI